MQNSHWNDFYKVLPHLSYIIGFPFENHKENNEQQLSLQFLFLFLSQIFQGYFKLNVTREVVTHIKVTRTGKRNRIKMLGILNKIWRGQI